MLKRLASSTLAALVTLCFAYSAITWGSMPGCAPAAGDSVHDPHGGAPHQHRPDAGHRPASTQCFIHLCCVQLATPASNPSTLVRAAAPERASAPQLVSQLVPARPAHTLPFAHAPPIARS